MSFLSQMCVSISYLMQEEPEIPDIYYIDHKGGENIGLQSYLPISVRQEDHTGAVHQCHTLIFLLFSYIYIYIYIYVCMYVCMFWVLNFLVGTAIQIPRCEL